MPVDDYNTMQVNFNVMMPGAMDPQTAGIGGLLNGVQRPTPLGKNDPFGTPRPPGRRRPFRYVRAGDDGLAG